MTRLGIDFAPARSWAARPLVWIMLMSSLVWCGFELWHCAQLVGERRALQADLDIAQSRAGESAARSLDKSQVPARDWKQAVRTVAYLNAPWADMLDDVQTSAGAQIALLGMEVDVAAADIRLQVEAKDVGALVAYMTRLHAVPGFESPVLESHQVSVQDPLQPVRFAVSMRWKAVAPDPTAPDARTPP